MKKPVSLFLLAMGLAMTSFCQGINFETGDWKTVLTKAKKEKKLVYVDVYTTWCVPCKVLAAEVFPKKEAGDKYNKLFINYRLDAEAGEGITLAKKYEVQGYPTHLFIDPVTESIIYRDAGATREVSAFNKHADIAVQERNDPMTWQLYMEKYKKGKYDLVFLSAGLKKSTILKKPNDFLLNSYIELLNQNKITDSVVLFLADHIQTVDNRATTIVTERKKVLNQAHPEIRNYYDNWMENLIYATFEKAVREKSENVLYVLQNARSGYQGKGEDAEYYWYKTEYYTRIEDEANALKASAAEAAFLTRKSLEDYQLADEAALPKTKETLLSQLKMMGVPEAELTEKVKLTLEKQPSRLHPVSAGAASRLNAISWKIYENHTKNGTMVEPALEWSHYSLGLASSNDDWASYADTYAHLLYIYGKKKDAVKVQQEAVNKAKLAGSDNMAELEDTLKKMKEGSL